MARGGSLTAALLVSASPGPAGSRIDFCPEFSSEPPRTCSCDKDTDLLSVGDEVSLARLVLARATLPRVDPEAGGMGSLLETVGRLVTQRGSPEVPLPQESSAGRGDESVQTPAPSSRLPLSSQRGVTAPHRPDPSKVTGSARGLQVSATSSGPCSTDQGGLRARASRARGAGTQWLQEPPRRPGSCLAPGSFVSAVVAGTAPPGGKDRPVLLKRSRERDLPRAAPNPPPPSAVHPPPISQRPGSSEPPGLEWHGPGSGCDPRVVLALSRRCTEGHGPARGAVRVCCRGSSSFPCQTSFTGCVNLTQ